MKYELKKLLSSVQVIICLFLVAAFLVLFVFYSYKGRNTQSEDYAALMNEYSQKYTDENELSDALDAKLDELQERLYSEGDNVFAVEGEYGENLMADFLLVNRAKNYADYIYKDILTHRRRIIRDSLRQMEETSDSNLLIEYQKAVEKYNVVIDTEFTSTGDLEPVMNHFDFTAWDYAMIAFVIMLTVRMFTLDRESGAYKMVCSSYYGKGRTFVNQLSVCMLAGFAIIIVHTLCQLICGSIFYGLNRYSLPLQSYKYFEFCPFKMTLGEYLLIKTAGKLLLVMSVVSAAAMITCLFRKNIPSVVTAIVIVIGSMLVNNKLYLMANDQSGSIIESQRRFESVRTFLPACLLKPDEYFRSLDYICIFNTAVPRFVCTAVITALISIICTVISYRAFTALRRV